MKRNRILNIEPDKVNDLIKKEAKEFATPLEKKMFKHFNISSCYTIPNIPVSKFYASYEEAQEFLDKSTKHKDYKIEHNFVLFMNRLK